MLTENDFASIKTMIDSAVGEIGLTFITGEVIKRDELRKLVWIKELGDQPIPLVGLKGAVRVYDTDLPIGSMMPFGSPSPPAEFLLCDGASYATSAYPELFAVLAYAYGGSGGNFLVPDMRGRIPVGRDSGQTEFDTLGEPGGIKAVTLQSTEMPVHSHGGATGNDSPDHAHGGTTGGSDRSLAHQHTVGSNSVATRQGTSAGNIVTGLAQTGGGNAPVLTTSDATPDHLHAFSTGGASVRHAHGIGSDGGLAGVTQPHSNLQPYQVTNYIIKAVGSRTKARDVVGEALPPAIGDTVLVALERGTRRLPRCLGVFQSQEYIRPGDD
jgi:microcystin-dependent protein